jgi:hypothetical protein
MSINNAKIKVGVKDPILIRPNETLGLIPKETGKKISVSQRKLFAAILLVSSQQGVRDRYRATLGDLLELANLKKHNLQEIKEIIFDMASPLDWVLYKNANNSEDGQRIVGLVSMISAPEFKQERNGLPIVMEWDLVPFIKSRLNIEKRFTPQRLMDVTNMRKGASIALYDLVTCYETNNREYKYDHKPIGWGTTGVRDLSTLTNILLGEKRNSEYPFAAFNRDVLQPAIQDIISNTNFFLEMVQHKNRQSVVGLEFIIIRKHKVDRRHEINLDVPQLNTIADNSQLTEHIDQLTILPDDLKLSFQKLGIPLESYAPLAIEYSPLKVKEKIRQMLVKKNIHRPLAYLKTLLKEDFVDEGKKSIAVVAGQVPFDFTCIDQDSERAKIEKDQMNEQWTWFELLPSVDQGELVKEWLSQLSDDFLVSTYRKSAFKNIMTKIDFSLWLKANHPVQTHTN